MSVPNLGTPAVPEFLPDEKQHRFLIAKQLNNVINGKINATLDVTLTHSATFTAVIDSRIGYYSAVIPAMALTANGATALSAGIWVDTIISGSCKLHHPSVAATDQKLRLVIIG